jgi:hypothetical protein
MGGHERPHLAPSRILASLEADFKLGLSRPSPACQRQS